MEEMCKDGMGNRAVIFQPTLNMSATHLLVILHPMSFTTHFRKSVPQSLPSHEQYHQVHTRLN